MSLSTCIKTDAYGKDVDEKMCWDIVISLIYLTVNRPDIMYNVCNFARFQVASKKSHRTAVKRIIRYLIWTTELGLWYAHSTHFYIICYSDADFACDKNDGKSTSGTCQMLEHSLVSWHNKKQASVALSTTESGYLVVESFGTQILWMIHQLLNYDLSYETVPTISDNTSVFINILCIIIGLSIKT